MFHRNASMLVQLGKRLDTRNWVPATAGNLSMRLAGGTLAVTRSGVHKGRMTEGDIMLVNPEGVSLDEKVPSAETLLHCLLYAIDPMVGAVIHTHSVAGTVLSRALVGAHAITLSGYELLKVFPGVDTHESTVQLPLVDNRQDMSALVDELRPLLLAEPRCVPAFYIRGHGLYAWGPTLETTEHTVEACEFLLACEWEVVKSKGATP